MRPEVAPCCSYRLALSLSPLSPCAGSVQFWGSKQQPELVRPPACCQHAPSSALCPSCGLLCYAYVCPRSGLCTLSCGGADGLGPLGLLGGVSISHSGVLPRSEGLTAPRPRRGHHSLASFLTVPQSAQFYPHLSMTSPVHPLPCP